MDKVIIYSTLTEECPSSSPLIAREAGPGVLLTSDGCNSGSAGHLLPADKHTGSVALRPNHRRRYHTARRRAVRTTATAATGDGQLSSSDGLLP